MEFQYKRACVRALLLSGSVMNLAFNCDVASAQSTTAVDEASPPANSQDNQGDVFGDIVVTAQKRAQSTQDVGISISAFRGPVRECSKTYAKGSERLQGVEQLV